MNAQVLSGLGRAFGGALIFALPLIMTMEFWSLGFYISPYKLALLLALTVPLLTIASWISGFEHNRVWLDSLVDAFVALAIGATMSTLVLYLFGVLTFDMPLSEVVGKVAVQSFPAGLGAVLARSQLGGQTKTADKRRSASNYMIALATMVVGALFLGLNVAPTEEVELISYKMGPWRMVVLIGVTLLLMHAFVYSLSFRGAPQPVQGATFLSQFFRYTLVGYGLVLLTCFYLLWTFGRTDPGGLQNVLSSVIVLGFPSAIGAAASRLIL